MDFLYTHENLYFGSDVVDLDTEKDRSFLQLQRYTKKICTDFELTNLANLKTDLEFEHKLWQIWSLKESSYKASQRKQGERRFKYRDFIVSPDFETVTDCHSDLQLSATTLQLKTAILSVVYFEDQNSISRDVSLIQKNHNRPVIVTWLDSSFQNQSDSSAVRQQLKEILLQFFGIEPDYYTVNRRSNHNGDLYPPELIIKDQVFPVSFSHHGKHLLTTLALQNNDATNTRIQTIVRTKWLNHRIDQKNRLVFILPTEF